MAVGRQLRRGLRALARRGTSARETHEEIEHFYAEAEAEAAGVPPRQRGDRERTRDQVRAYGWENAVEALAADLRYGTRQLRRHPGFTLTAVGVLALGIGVGTAMFSVLNAVLLRPLPYAHSTQLVSVMEPRGQDPVFWGTSHLDAEDWQRASHGLSSLAYYQMNEGTIEGTAQSIEVGDYPASANLFSTLGVALQQGRGFTAAEVAAHARVAVLSYALWQKWFQGQPAVGKYVRLDGADYTVAGVLPPDFRFPYIEPADLFIPYEPASPDARGNIDLQVIARLRPGASLQAAQAELSATQAGIAERNGGLHLPSRVVIRRYVDTLAGSSGLALESLGLAVGLVWLIACASVAGLLLTRLMARRRELAVRQALGAGRGRVVRQLLSENLLLGLLAGAGGWALAALALDGLRPFLALHLPQAARVGLSPAVLGVLLGGTLLSVALIGVAPALGAARTPAADGLQDRSGSGSRAQTRLRHGLVVGEIALALLLLCGAGLLLRTLAALNRVALGFRTDNIVTTRLNIPRDQYLTRSIDQFLEAPLLARLQSLPGVEAAALTSVVPLASGVNVKGEVGIVGRPNLSPDQMPQGDMRYTSPGYTKVFGIVLEHGRFFDAALDTPTSQAVVVVNHAFAAKYFPGQNPVGQALEIGKGKSAAIIGELADVHGKALNRPAQPEMHFSTTQLGPQGAAPFYNIGAQFVQLAVRGPVPTATLVPEIRSALHAVAPQVAPGDFATMRQLVAASMGDQTFAADMLALFGLAALAIALAGLYGLLAYTVALRRREMGIRLALGASRRQIANLVLGQAAWLIGIGTALGLGLSLALARVLASYVYGVSARDPLTLAAAAALLAAAGLSAAYWPARRAARVSPTEALRAE